MTSIILIIQISFRKKQVGVLLLNSQFDEFICPSSTTSKSMSTMSANRRRRCRFRGCLCKFLAVMCCGGQVLFVLSPLLWDLNSRFGFFNFPPIRIFLYCRNVLSFGVGCEVPSELFGPESLSLLVIRLLTFLPTFQHVPF